MPVSSTAASASSNTVVPKSNVVSSSLANNTSTSPCNRSRNSLWCRCTQNESDRLSATSESASCATCMARRMAVLAGPRSHRYPSRYRTCARATSFSSMSSGSRVEATPRWVAMVRSPSLGHVHQAPPRGPVVADLGRCRSAVHTPEHHPRRR